MDTVEPRNPYILGLGVVGAVSGVLAVILALVAASEANRLGYPDGNIYIGPDLVVVALLFAWADIFGLISLVTIVGALVIAGARWAPRASPPITSTSSSLPQLESDLEPPGGLTPGERRLLGGAGSDG